MTEMKVNLGRKDYESMRSVIRRNVHINSETAFLRRYDLSYEMVEVLMGGVIIAREEYVERISQVGRAQISSFVPKSTATGEGWPDNVIGEVPQIVLKIYDFSGTFTVKEFIQDSEDKDLRLELFNVRAGQIVYVLGKVIPIDGSSGYIVRPTSIWDETSLDLYKVAFTKELAELKRRVEVVKHGPIQERIEEVLDNSYNVMDIVRCFLKKDPRLTDFDYAELARTISHVFRRRPSARLAYLMVRYYNKYLESTDGSRLDKAKWLAEFIGDVCVGDPLLRQYFPFDIGTQGLKGDKRL